MKIFKRSPVFICENQVAVWGPLRGRCCPFQTLTLIHQKEMSGLWAQSCALKALPWSFWSHSIKTRVWAAANGHGHKWNWITWLWASTYWYWFPFGLLFAKLFPVFHNKKRAHYRVGLCAHIVRIMCPEGCAMFVKISIERSINKHSNQKPPIRQDFQNCPGSEICLHF